MSAPIFGAFLIVAVPLALAYAVLKFAVRGEANQGRADAVNHLLAVRTDHLIWAELLEDRERQFKIDDVVGTPEYHRDQADKLRLCIEALGYEGIPHA